MQFLSEKTLEYFIVKSAIKAAGYAIKSNINPHPSVDLALWVIKKDLEMLRSDQADDLIKLYKSEAARYFGVCEATIPGKIKRILL